MNFNSNPPLVDLILSHNPERKAKVEIIHTQREREKREKREREREHWRQMARERHHHVAGTQCDVALFTSLYIVVLRGS